MRDKFGANSVVCEDHFEDSCFDERSTLQARLMGWKIRKRLKPDAVPTIFVHRLAKSDTGRKTRLEPRNKLKVKSWVKSSRKMTYKRLTVPVNLKIPSLKFKYYVDHKKHALQTVSWLMNYLHVYSPSMALQFHRKKHNCPLVTAKLVFYAV